MGGNWQRTEFGLINKKTGEVYDAELRIRRHGGKFMKVWQGTGWLDRIATLRGISLRVLLYLVEVANYNNVVPSPGQVAKAMGQKQSNISRAYSELRGAELLLKSAGFYYLSPFFCWKGSESQYDIAVAKLTSGEVKELT